jgi:uncharacterized protein (DUF1015 family)
MAEVKPFRGVRYTLERPEQAADVICPPYDVISPAMQAQLLARSESNVVRLELPIDEPSDDGANNRYTRAAALYRQWQQSGVLAKDDSPSIYLYGQRYFVDGKPQERLGLLGALKVEPYEAGVVLPHEQTFPKHKEDRYRMLTAAQAQFSPIFGLYSAPEKSVRTELDRWAATPPIAIAPDPEGVEHRLWAIDDPAFARWAAEVFAGRQVFIADGHHRYETALRYRNERRAAAPDAPLAAHDHVMTFLVEMDDPGLVLLPTHRLLRNLPNPAPGRAMLEKLFQWETTTVDAALNLQHHQIGLLLSDGSAHRLTLRDPKALDAFDTEHSEGWRDLDVAILHRLVLEEGYRLTDTTQITYTRDPQEAVQRVQTGEFAAAFLLPPPRVEELKIVAGAGDRMPEKSTYFWPKAMTGLVIYE